MTGGAKHGSGLVPLADRLRYMQFFRLVIAVVVAISWVLLPDSRHLGPYQLAGITAGYLVMSQLTTRVLRLQRERALSAFGLTLLADGIYLAVVSHATAGFGNPVQYLVLLHLVGVTLLASFRTGMKIAMWHSLLATSVYQLQHEKILTAPADSGRLGPGVEVVVFLVILWLVTLATASFASVNERELRRRNYDLQALARLSWRLESALQPHEVARALIDAVSDDFGIGRLVLVAGPNGQLAGLAGKGTASNPTTCGPAGDALLVKSMHERRTLRLAEPRPKDNPWLCAVLPSPNNVVCLPLYADGVAVGVLVVEHGGGRAARMERRVVEMLERFVSQASLALNNAWLLAQVHALAAADGLTGVANRRTFDAALPREIARSNRSGRPLSLVLFDVDHFKRLNDTFGHQAGDEALQRVAAVLQSCAREFDLVARYGGEEFTVLLPDTDLHAGALVGERLRAAVEGLPGEPRMTASLGVACYPLNAGDGTGLVQAADEALYAAKQGGRNRVVVSGRGRPAIPAQAGPPVEVAPGVPGVPSPGS